MIQKILEKKDHLDINDSKLMLQEEMLEFSRNMSDSYVESEEETSENISKLSQDPNFDILNNLFD